MAYTPPLPPGSWAMKNNLLLLRWNLVWEPELMSQRKPQRRGGSAFLRERSCLIACAAFFAVLDFILALYFHFFLWKLFCLVLPEIGVLFLFWWGLGVKRDTLWTRGRAKKERAVPASYGLFNLLPCIIFSVCCAPFLTEVLRSYGSFTAKAMGYGLGLCAALAYLFLCGMYNWGHVLGLSSSASCKKRNLIAFLILGAWLMICGIEFCWSFGNQVQFVR